MTKELAKTLTIALVSYLDENRPEGAMDCSSGECVSLEKAFAEENFDSVETLINKKLSRLTEFEEGLVNFYNKRSMLVHDKDGVVNKHECEELLHESAKKLLALAKKELCPLCDEHLKGFSEGYDKANEVKSYRFPPNHIWSPLCWEPGGTCTNPHMDCFNCPRKTTGGWNLKTSAVTSISKEEG